MPTAFGRAILDTVNGQPQRFRMTMVGGPTMEMDCGDFLHCRQEEQELLDRLELPPDGKVLDYGCGAARHLSYVRKKHSRVHCIGIEICDLLREHCAQVVPAPSAFYGSWEEVPDRDFDLILLVGNGLGVLGAEDEAARRMAALVDSLGPKGRIVIETGNPFGRGYSSANFTIAYKDWQDGPFTWGYADRAWLSATLEHLGCRVEFTQSHAAGGMFFFAVAQRTGQDAIAKGNA